jgi:UDP-N-acetylglucosamine acyltransferase
MKIHPAALVSKEAKLAEDVEVGPHTTIGKNVSIGQGTKVGNNCLIDGHTTIGRNCRIFTGAVVGSIPQDLKYKGEISYLEIGDGNIIREYCTFNPGTTKGSKTIVGNNNLFMAYSHIAHDCVVGNNCAIANSGTLAGHVKIEDHVIVGGLVAIHQFVRVGRLSIIGGCSKVVQDIPPFSTCDGHPTRVYGLNLVGLRRAGLSPETIRYLKSAFRAIFNSGLSFNHAVEQIESQGELCSEVAYLLDFIKNSQRGICRGVR